MKFSMIELITSLTPAGHLQDGDDAGPERRRPAMATTMISSTCSGAGSATAAPAAAAMIVASRYWPSTPMLNRPIRKAIGHRQPGEEQRDRPVDDHDHRGDLLARGVAEVDHHLEAPCSGLTCSGGHHHRGDDDARRRRPGPARAAPARPGGATFTPHPPRSCAPVMWPPSSSGRHLPRVEGGHQPAAQHHVQGVRQTDQLVEVGRDQQDAHPLGPGVLEQLPDGRLRADVDPAGRVGGDQQPRVRRSSRGRRSASAGCRRTAPRPSVSGPGARTSYSRMIRSVSARAALRSMNDALGRRRAGLVAEDPVLPQRRLEQHALPVPVLGDEADAGLAAGAGWSTAVMSSSPEHAPCRPRAAAGP